MSFEHQEELLTVREVARRLRVDGTTVRRWVNDSVLEAMKFPPRSGRQVYRIRTSVLDALLKQGENRQ